jgi:hypothetical protein
LSRGLLDVLHRDHAAQAEVVVDDQHLLDAVLVQQLQHLVLGRALAHRDQPLARRHDLADRLVERVSKRRSRLVTMPTSRSPSTTGTPEMPRARVSSSTSRMVLSGPTVIGSLMMPLSNFLTAAHLARLRSARHVLVDDADAAFLGQRDREARLGDGVHRGGHSGRFRSISAGQAGAQADVARQDFRVGGLEQDVVEGEGFLDQAHRGVPSPAGMAVNRPFYAPARGG